MTFFTALERILHTERLRQRAARQGGFAIPAMHEVSMGASSGPLLASNMKGSFLPTRPSSTGVARYGFSYVPVGQEDALLRELHRVLTGLSESSGGPSKCQTVLMAVQKMSQWGIEPRNIVIGPESIPDILGGLSTSAAWGQMRANQPVGFYHEVPVLLADLPAKAALVCTAPPLVGYYTRAGEHLGVLIQRSHQSIVVVP